jgi:hypothetical protein
MANVLYRRLGAESGATFTQATNSTAEVVMAAESLPARFIDKRCGIRIRAQVDLPATNSTDTFRLRLRLGTTVLSEVAAFDATNNDKCTVTFEGVIDHPNQLLHGFGVSYRTGQAGVYLGTDDLAFNTQADQSLNITGTWSVANAGNVANLKCFNVEIFPEDAA